MNAQADDHAQSEVISQDVVEKCIPDATTQQLEEQLQLEENHEDQLEIK